MPDTHQLHYYETEEGGIGIQVLDTLHTDPILPHTHDFFELVYVLEGFTVHSFNEETSFLTEGDIFYVPPGVSHGYAGLHYTKVYNCVFTRSALGEDLDKLMALPGLGDLADGQQARWNRVRLSPAERIRALDILKGMQEELRRKQYGWQMVLRAMLVQLITLFSRSYSCHYMQDTADYSCLNYIVKLIHYIEQNYAGEISLPGMAATVGLSVDYLTKQFKKIVGLSPTAFLRHYRFARAIDLIQKGKNLPMAQISASVGYRHISHFSRDFKAFSGVSPSDYRKKSMEAR